MLQSGVKWMTRFAPAPADLCTFNRVDGTQVACEMMMQTVPAICANVAGVHRRHGRPFVAQFRREDVPLADVVLLPLADCDTHLMAFVRPHADASGTLSWCTEDVALYAIEEIVRRRATGGPVKTLKEMQVCVPRFTLCPKGDSASLIRFDNMGASVVTAGGEHVEATVHAVDVEPAEPVHVCRQRVVIDSPFYCTLFSVDNDVDDACDTAAIGASTGMNALSLLPVLQYVADPLVA